MLCPVVHWVTWRHLTHDGGWTDSRFQLSLMEQADVSWKFLLLREFLVLKFIERCAQCSVTTKGASRKIGNPFLMTPDITQWYHWCKRSSAPAWILSRFKEMAHGNDRSLKVESAYQNKVDMVQNNCQVVAWNTSTALSGRGVTLLKE
jgi:hypothetical protein